MNQVALFSESDVLGSEKSPRLMVRCRECNRPLRSAEARRAGVGSTCGLREVARQQRRLERRRARRSPVPVQG